MMLLAGDAYCHVPGFGSRDWGFGSAMSLCSCGSGFSRSHKVAGMRQRPGCPGRFESPIPNHQSLPSSRKQRLHLLPRVRLDLADAFGGDAVLVGQSLKGDLVVVVQPTDMAAAAGPGVQWTQSYH